MPSMPGQAQVQHHQVEPAGLEQLERRSPESARSAAWSCRASRSTSVRATSGSSSTTRMRGHQAHASRPDDRLELRTQSAALSETDRWRDRGLIVWRTGSHLTLVFRSARFRPCPHPQIPYPRNRGAPSARPEPRRPAKAEVTRGNRRSGRAPRPHQAEAGPAELPGAPLDRHARGLPRDRDGRARAWRATLPAPLRHDPVARRRRSTRATTSATCTTASSTTRSTTGATPSSASTRRSCASWTRQVGGPRLRHREAHPAAARAGRLVEVHDRAPAEEGARASTRTQPRGRALHVRLEDRPRRPGPRRVQWCPMHEEPLLLVPLESQDARRRGAQRAAAADRLPHPASTGDLVPLLPQGLPGPDDAVRRRLGAR